jgi:hypothetical protein
VYVRLREVRGVGFLTEDLRKGKGVPPMVVLSLSCKPDGSSFCSWAADWNFLKGLTAVITAVVVPETILWE